MKRCARMKPLCLRLRRAQVRRYLNPYGCLNTSTPLYINQFTRINNRDDFIYEEIDVSISIGMVLFRR